jgi:hypothetical protein
MLSKKEKLEGIETYFDEAIELDQFISVLDGINNRLLKISLYHSMRENGIVMVDPVLVDEKTIYYLSILESFIEVLREINEKK